MGNCKSTIDIEENIEITHNSLTDEYTLYFNKNIYTLEANQVPELVKTNLETTYKYRVTKPESDYKAIYTWAKTIEEGENTCVILCDQKQKNVCIFQQNVTNELKAELLGELWSKSTRHYYVMTENQQYNDTINAFADENAEVGQQSIYQKVLEKTLVFPQIKFSKGNITYTPMTVVEATNKLSNLSLGTIDHQFYDNYKIYAIEFVLNVGKKYNIQQIKDTQSILMYFLEEQKGSSILFDMAKKYKRM